MKPIYMKKYITILFALLFACLTGYAENAKRCSSQDIPMNMRKDYIRQATDMLHTYYTQLPLNIGNLMVQNVFVERFMQDGKNSYMPEFLPQMKDSQNFLSASQYMQELNKIFAEKEEECSFQIRDVSISPEDFFTANMVSCYVKATYKLDILHKDERMATRECEAYCLFPRALVSIDVKLMQVQPVNGNDFQLVKPAIEKAADVSPPMTEAIQTSMRTVSTELNSKPAVTAQTDLWHYLTHPQGGYFLLLCLLLAIALWTCWVCLNDSIKIADITFGVFLLAIAIGCYALIGVGLYYTMPLMPHWMKGFETIWFWLVCIICSLICIFSLFDIKNCYQMSILSGIVSLIAGWMIYNS